MLFPPTPPADPNDPLAAAVGSELDSHSGFAQTPLSSSSGSGHDAPRQRPNYDVVLFIGMAAPRQFYTLETHAHRDGYLFPDVDGETMEGDRVWTGMEAPAVLGTGFDTEDVWRRWKGGCVVGSFFLFFRVSFKGGENYVWGKETARTE